MLFLFLLIVLFGRRVKRWMGALFSFLDRESNCDRMPVKEVSDGGLKQELERAGGKLVLVDFFATWCLFSLIVFLFETVQWYL